MRAKTVNRFNEMAIADVDFYDVVTDKLVADILEQLVDEEEAESEDMKARMKYELEERYTEISYKFEEELINENGEISIYRRMTVKPDWLKHLEKQGGRLGIYWSWDPDAAETHWGFNQSLKTIMIESSIKSEYVDWVETLQLNISPLYEEEKEVRLFKNTPIKIKAIYDQKGYEDGKAMRISPNIKNKIFKA